MKKTILAIFPMALLASCSSDLADIVSNQSNGNVEKVTIKTKAFEYEDGTRTELTATNKGISFAWANGDVLGVFPIAPSTNNQAKFELTINTSSCENDAHYASFDGAGWALDSKNSYAAYTPYTKSADSYDEVPFSLTGQDGTLATIGEKYDFMYAPSTFTSEDCSTGKAHEVVFDFSHSVAILQLKLTMPVAATWKSVILEDKLYYPFIPSARINVSDGRVMPEAFEPSIVLSLNNVMTTADSKELTLYAAVLPTMTNKIRLTAITSEGEKYFASLAGKTFVAGKAYRYTVSELAAVPATGTENGYAWVDLDLPSGLKWATMNVGASSPEGYGNYYAWGETTPQSSNTYDWSSYKWYNSTDDVLTKYCFWTYYSTYDGLQYLQYEDDAARVNWGGTWRMPSDIELQELVENCYWVWTSNYGKTNMAGYIIYKVKSESDKGAIVYSGNTPSDNYSLSDTHIFLPAAGYRSNGSLSSAGSDGYYWAARLSDYDTWAGMLLNFSSSGRKSDDRTDRCCGQSVRAVCE